MRPTTILLACLGALSGSACFSFSWSTPRCSPSNCSGCCDSTNTCRLSCGSGGGTGFGGGSGFGGGFTDGGFVCQPVAGGGAGGGGGAPSITTAWSPAPITGGTVVAVDDSLAVVLDPDRERVWTVGLPSGPASAIVFPAGSRPGRAVVDAAGLVHVVLRGSAQVAHLNPRLSQLLGIDALACPEPRGIDVHAATQDLVVACRGGEVVRFQPGGPQTVTHLGDDLRDVLLDGDAVTVSSFRAASLARFDTTAGGSAARTELPTVTGGTPEVAWRTVRVGPGKLSVYQEATTANIVTGSGMCPAGSAAVSSAYGTPAGNFAGALPPDACTALAMKSALSWDVGDGSTVSALIGDVLPVDVAAQPMDVSCTHPSLCSKTINVAVAGAGGSASLYRLTPGNPVFGCMTPQVRVPGAFTGAAFLPSGRVVLHDRSASALVVMDPATGATLNTVRYASDSVDSDGSRLFHSVPEGGVSITCASCHPEGGEDGHTWLLDGELRRTQSLQGGVLQRAPFHWKANLPTLGALMDDTFVQRMGAHAPSTDAVTSLSAWLDTLPAPKASSTAPAEQLARGRAAFEKAACEGCHSGAQLSNHLPVSVGTQGGTFKTPALVGVAARGPWMHDGCAKTLEQRFTDPSCGGSLHGNPAALAPWELTDLLAYLESL